MSNTEIIICDDLKNSKIVSHAFFTNRGGVSEGIYSSLNLGYGSKDKRENIDKNYQILIDRYNNEYNKNYDVENIHTLNQIHSNEVIEVSKINDLQIKADAMVTKNPEIVLGILTADCVPVLYVDEENKIIGAAHSGWKGAICAINENTIDAMCKIGADINNIKALIGPAIAQESYEVDDKFYQIFIEKNSEYIKYFKDSRNISHYYFNLKLFVADRIKDKGVTKIFDVKTDTYKEKDKLFSYRRSCHLNHSDYGRNISLISL